MNVYLAFYISENCFLSLEKCILEMIKCKNACQVFSTGLNTL